MKNINECVRNFLGVNMIILYHSTWYTSWLQPSELFIWRSKFVSHKWKFQNMMKIETFKDFDLDIVWGLSTQFGKDQKSYFWKMKLIKDDSLQ